MSLTPIYNRDAVDANIPGAASPEQRNAVKSPWGTLMVSLDRFLTANIQNRFGKDSGAPQNADTSQGNHGAAWFDSDEPTNAERAEMGAPMLLAVGLVAAGAFILLVK